MDRLPLEKTEASSTIFVCVVDVCLPKSSVQEPVWVTLYGFTFVW